MHDLRRGDWLENVSASFGKTQEKVELRPCKEEGYYERQLRNRSVQEVRVREIPWALGFEQGRR